MLKFGDTYLKYGDTYLTDYKGKIEPYPFEEVRIGPQVWAKYNLSGAYGHYIRVDNFTNIDNSLGTQYFYWEVPELNFPGWRIPTQEDFEILKNTIGNDASKIRSSSGWLSNNGTDDYGFSLLPLGYILGSIEGQIKEYVDAGKWPEHGYITQAAYLKTLTMEPGVITYRVCAYSNMAVGPSGATLDFSLVGDLSNYGTGWPVYMPIRLIKDV